MMNLDVSVAENALVHHSVVYFELDTTCDLFRPCPTPSESSKLFRGEVIKSLEAHKLRFTSPLSKMKLSIPSPDYRAIRVMWWICSRSSSA